WGDVPGGTSPAACLDQVDAVVQHGGFLRATHRDRILVAVTVHPDLVARVDDLVELTRERFDGVARPERRCGDVVTTHQRVQSGYADFAREDPTGNVAGRVLSPVRAQPTAHGVDVDPERHEDFLTHRILLFPAATGVHRYGSTVSAVIATSACRSNAKNNRPGYSGSPPRQTAPASTRSTAPPLPYIGTVGPSGTRVDSPTLVPLRTALRVQSTSAWLPLPAPVPASTTAAAPARTAASASAASAPGW